MTYKKVVPTDDKPMSLEQYRWQMLDDRFKALEKRLDQMEEKLYYEPR